MHFSILQNMNKLGFALLLFATIGIGMVGTLIETQVILHPVYAHPPGDCPNGGIPLGYTHDGRIICQGPSIIG